MLFRLLAISVIEKNILVPLYQAGRCKLKKKLTFSLFCFEQAAHKKFGSGRNVRVELPCCLIENILPWNFHSIYVQRRLKIWPLNGRKGIRTKRVPCGQNTQKRKIDHCNRSRELCEPQLSRKFSTINLCTPIKSGKHRKVSA